jgi:hypothetical protein
MLSDPAPDLLVNDIPASSPNSATGRSIAPQHTAKIIGCSLARLPDQRTRHTGGVLPVVTGFRERLPVGGEVLTFFVPGVPRVFVPCRVVCRQSCCRPRRVAAGGALDVLDESDVEHGGMCPDGVHVKPLGRGSLVKAHFYQGLHTVRRQGSTIGTSDVTPLRHYTRSLPVTG